MRILIIGGSNEAAGRNTEDFYDLGKGFVKLAAEMLYEKYSGAKLEVLNRGIAGNHARDLAARWSEDAIALNPDVIVIGGFGLNDSWHTINKGVKQEIYEENYRNILERTKKETNAKIVIMEQFLIPHPNGEVYRADTNHKIQITRRLAREFADGYIPLDGLIAAECVGKDISELTSDGVHFTEPIARLIASLTVEAIEELGII